MGYTFDVDCLKFLKDQFFALSRLFYQKTVKHPNSVQNPELLIGAGAPQPIGSACFLWEMCEAEGDTQASSTVVD